MLFGKKRPDGKTLLVLDVEQGSVGSSLVRLAPGEAPKLFGETRVLLRVPATRDSASLLANLLAALREALIHSLNVAARVRVHPQTAPLGDIAQAAVFLAAPWGVPNLSADIPHFAAPMREGVATLLDEILGDMPHSLFTAAGGIAAGSAPIMPHQTYLLVLAGSEITELVLMHDGAVAGYATAPAGRATLTRTLRAHGAHEEELASLLKLTQGPFNEALRLTGAHWAAALAEASAPLVPRAPVRHVWVVAHGAPQHQAQWFARALEQSPEFGRLFPTGGELRALTPQHVMRYIAAHAPEPDLALSLQALYSSGLW